MSESGGSEEDSGGRQNGNDPAVDGRQQGVVEVTPEERINELNDIDQDVSKMLRSVSAAIGVLGENNQHTRNPTLEDAQDEFKTHADSFYATLASIAVRLRRQAYALEEAGLIEEGTRLDAQRATSMIEDTSRRGDGDGMLDSSWLNARAKDTTGKALRAETISQLKEFLQKQNITVPNGDKDTMDVDAAEGS